MDHEAAKKIADAFVRFMETNDAGDVFADRVFADINVPEWRFQMQGRETIQAWLRDEQPDGSSVPTWRSDPMVDGVVVEVEQHTGDEISRNIHRLEVRDGKIVEWTMYCTGVWSAETQAKQRDEAPMIRP
ncbi:MAG: hypothetical protein WD826_01930 [Actinomycetota bacterium]